MKDDIRNMSDDELLAQINAHDPYDVEFARRFTELRARVVELEADGAGAFWANRAREIAIALASERSRADLIALAEAVEAGELVTVPSPKVEGFTARIMAYAEGYVMMRHKGYEPFLVGKKDLLAVLRAKIWEVE